LMGAARTRWLISPASSVIPLAMGMSTTLRSIRPITCSAEMISLKVIFLIH